MVNAASNEQLSIFRLLEQRVAEADAAPDDYITFEEWKRRRRERRAV